MLVNSTEIKVKKKDAMKQIIRKIPLISKIDQFNRKIDDVHLEYVEFKILKYEITSKKKNKSNFRCEDLKRTIIMMVNTYNGHSQSIEEEPETIRRYIARGCIKKSNIKEEYIIEKVKNEIVKYIDKKNNRYYSDKHILKGISIIEVTSVYMPYWIGSYNGKSIFVPA